MMAAKQHLFEVRDYQVHHIIGEGAYGVVALGYHRRSRQPVAIKKIEPFQKDLFCLRTLREIMLLKYFKHENVIRILDIPKPLNFDSFKEIYIVQEFMETDLNSVIQTQILSNDHIQYMLYQMLKGIKYIHSCGVIHRDLKPANLLVNSNCDLKICDFGLARLDSEPGDSKELMTEYVATRWYRAPEVMLSVSQYSKAIDIWSIGCILAEMILRSPLLPGKDYRNQINLIFELLGTPQGQELECVKSRRARDYIKSLKVYKGISFKRIFQGTDPNAIHIMERMLTFDPERRITADQSLEHEYVSTYRAPEDEITSEKIPKESFFFDSCKSQMAMVDMKRLMYSHIVESSSS